MWMRTGDVRKMFIISKLLLFSLNSVHAHSHVCSSLFIFAYKIQFRPILTLWKPNVALLALLHKI